VFLMCLFNYSTHGLLTCNVLFSLLCNSVLFILCGLLFCVHCSCYCSVFIVLVIVHCSCYCSLFLHCASLFLYCATLTEVFPCFFLSCKANARV
jgi:hypothetical protein